MKYSIRIPGNLYHALAGRDVFRNSGETAELAVWRAATEKKVGKGTSYVLEGSQETLNLILDYLWELPGLVTQGIVPAYEFGVSLDRLRSVADQAIVVTG